MARFVAWEGEEPSLAKGRLRVVCECLVTFVEIRMEDAMGAESWRLVESANTTEAVLRRAIATLAQRVVPRPFQGGEVVRLLCGRTAIVTPTASAFDVDEARPREGRVDFPGEVVRAIDALDDRLRQLEQRAETAAPVNPEDDGA